MAGIRRSDRAAASGNARVAKQTSVDRAWWTTFNDETLNNLIEEAYKQNLDLQISGLRILEARALLGIAVGLQFPENQNAIASAKSTADTNLRCSAGSTPRSPAANRATCQRNWKKTANGWNR